MYHNYTKIYNLIKSIKLLDILSEMSKYSICGLYLCLLQNTDSETETCSKWIFTIKVQWQ